MVAFSGLGASMRFFPKPLMLLRVQRHGAVVLETVPSELAGKIRLKVCYFIDQATRA